MSDASADRAVSHGPTPRPPKKYSAVDELERFAYTKPMVKTTMKYMSIAKTTRKSLEATCSPFPCLAETAHVRRADYTP